MSDPSALPSARERLAAARAMAGLPAARATARETAPAPAAAGRRRRTAALIAAAVAVAALLAVAWWLAGRDSGLVDATRQLQRRVLAGEVRGREMKRAVDSIVRNVDQMSRDELKAAREGLDADWRVAYESGLTAYYDAPEESRAALLDEAIDRTLAFRQLRFGLNPQAAGPYAGRIRRGDGRRGRDREEKKDDDPAAEAKRTLAEKYAAAIRDRAKERKIDLPEWR